MASTMELPQSEAGDQKPTLTKTEQAQNRLKNLQGKATAQAQKKLNPNNYIDSENGVYFGRTPASWLKITIFYIVYYFLLYCIYVVSLGLSTNTLTYYSFKTPSDAIVYKPKLRTRVDQPGLTVYPQNNLFEGRGSDNVLHFNSKSENAINEITNVLLHRVIRPNLQTCDRNGPVYSYSERPLQTHKTRFSLIRRQYREDRKRPLIILKLNRIIDWEPKAITQVKGELRDKIEEFHTGNVYFTCKGKESTDPITGKVSQDSNFKRVKFLNPDNGNGKTHKNGQSWANGCDKAGDEVGCIPVSWFDTYYGNDPFSDLRSKAPEAEDDEIDPCDAAIIEGDDETLDQCELNEAERLDKGYKEKLMAKGIIPKIVSKHCWPFMIGLVEAKDISKPVSVQCKAWLANTDVLKNTPAEDTTNHVEVVFGFRDLNSCDPSTSDCNHGGWFENDDY